MYTMTCFTVCHRHSIHSHSSAVTIYIALASIIINTHVVSISYSQYAITTPAIWIDCVCWCGWFCRVVVVVIVIIVVVYEVTWKAARSQIHSASSTRPIIELNRILKLYFWLFLIEGFLFHLRNYPNLYFSSWLSSTQNSFLLETYFSSRELNQCQYRKPNNIRNR